MRTSIVIPALNEGRIIGKTVREYRRWFPKSEVIVVDGGSKDKTAEKAAREGALVCCEKTSNAAEALLVGFKQARGQRIIMTDADNTYPAEWASVLYYQMLKNKLDLIIGQRIGNRFLSHRLATTAIGWLAALAFGVRTNDIASGLRIMSRRFVKRCKFQADEGMWLDMIIKAHRRGYRYDYEPICYRPRTSGVSKIKGKGLKVVRCYLRAIWREVRRR